MVTSPFPRYNLRWSDWIFSAVPPELPKAVNPAHLQLYKIN